LHELEVVVVHLGDDFRRPLLGELRQLVGQVDRLQAHQFLLSYGRCRPAWRTARMAATRDGTTSAARPSGVRASAGAGSAWSTSTTTSVTALATSRQRPPKAFVSYHSASSTSVRRVRMPSGRLRGLLRRAIGT